MLIESFIFTAIPMPIIVRLITISLHVQAPVGNASKKPKVATKVSSVFGNDSDEDSWSLPEGGSTCMENDFKGPMGVWDAMYVSPSVVPLAWSRYEWWASGQPHMNKQELEHSPANCMDWRVHCARNLYYSCWIFESYLYQFVLAVGQCPLIWRRPFLVFTIIVGF